MASLYAVKLSNISIKRVKAAEPPKPNCTIPIYFEDYTHLEDLPINKILRSYNEFISLTFGNKSQKYDIERIQKVGKVFGINLTLKEIYEEELNPKR